MEVSRYGDNSVLRVRISPEEFMTVSKPSSEKEGKTLWLESVVKWVFANPALAVALAPLLLTGVRLLGVTRGQIEPALFLLAHGDKFSILLGTFLPWIPILSIFFTLVFLRSAIVFRRRRGQHDVGTPSSSDNADTFGFVFCLALSAFLASISLLLMALVFAAFCLDIDWKRIFAFLLPRRKRPQKRDPKVFREDGVPFFLLLVLVVSLLVPFLPSSHFWLPAEDVRMINGQIYSGIVVSSDSNFTYILTKDLGPKVVDTSWIQQRTPCRMDNFEDPPIRFYVHKEVHVSLQECHTTTNHSA